MFTMFEKKYKSEQEQYLLNTFDEKADSQSGSEPQASSSSFHSLSVPTHALVGTYLIPNDLNTPLLPEFYQLDSFPANREEIDILSPPREQEKWKYSSKIFQLWCYTACCDGDDVDSVIRLACCPVMSALLCCSSFGDWLGYKKHQSETATAEQVYQDTFLGPAGQSML